MGQRIKSNFDVDVDYSVMVLAKTPQMKCIHWKALQK